MEIADGPFPYYKHNLYGYRQQAETLLDQMDPGRWYTITAGVDFQGKMASFEAILRKVARSRNLLLFASIDQQNRERVRVMYKKVMPLS